jgi:protein required for attachment to host cells
MNTIWLLVCDACRGRLFRVRDDGSPWELVDSFSHDASRSKASELASDRQGRSAPRGDSVHRNALAPASSLKERETDHFVQTLVTALERGLNAHAFHRWVLVAPPHFLGKLKNGIGPELSKHLLATLDKELSEREVPELRDRLHEFLRIPPNQREVLRASAARGR